MLHGSSVRAQESHLAFVGARIIRVSGAEIEGGALVVQNGKIVAVGPAGSVTIPPGATRFDVPGKVIMPGLVDTHNHIGGFGGADSSAPIQPEIRIYDSLNALDPGFRRAVSGGLTTLNIMPGSGHLLSGQTIYVKLRGGKTIEDLFIRDAQNHPMGGMKMANGTNSMREKPFPGTRGKSAALVREKFIKAIEYRDKLAAAIRRNPPSSTFRKLNTSSRTNSCPDSATYFGSTVCSIWSSVTVRPARRCDSRSNAPGICRMLRAG